MAAVGVQLGGQDARGFRGTHDDGAGAVAEQHAGGAVFEIEDARKHFGADHQHVLVHAGLDEGVGGRDRVHEAAADGLHVEGALWLCMPSLRWTMQAVLGKLPWKSGVELATITRSMSCGCLPAISSARGPLHRQVGRQLVGRGIVARRNAAARHDPLVRGLDALGRQLAVRSSFCYALLWQVAAGADNFAVEVIASFLLDSVVEPALGVRRAGISSAIISRLALAHYISPHRRRV
jgi:hypothetical protein